MMNKMTRFVIGGLASACISSLAFAQAYDCGLLIGRDPEKAGAVQNFELSTAKHGVGNPVKVDFQGYHVTANVDGATNEQFMHLKLTNPKGTTATTVLDFGSFRSVQSLSSDDGSYAQLQCRRRS